MEFLYENYFNIGYVLAIIAIIYSLIKGDFDGIISIVICAMLWIITLPIIFVSICYVYYRTGKLIEEKYKSK